MACRYLLGLFFCSLLLFAAGGQSRTLQGPDEPAIDVSAALAADDVAATVDAGSAVNSAVNDVEVQAITTVFEPLQTTPGTGALAVDLKLAFVTPTTTQDAEDEKAVLTAVATAKAKLAAALNDTSNTFQQLLRSNFFVPIPNDPKSSTERLAIFRDNLVNADAGNVKRNDPYFAQGITKFSHMTKDEFKSIILSTPLVNITKDSPLYHHRRLQQGSLPCSNSVAFSWGSVTTSSSVDWRDAGVITPIRDQRGCGSCSAFAVTGAFESTFIRKWSSRGYRNTNTDLAEDDFLECKSGNQCSGAWPDSYLSRGICSGQPFETSVPYDASDSNRCPSVTRYIVGASAFTYVPANKADLARAVTKTPTVITVDASNWSDYAAGYVRNCGEPAGDINHAVLVVGYRNNRVMSNGETWDYWIIRNSWGTDFVDSGYIRVRKDCSSTGGAFNMYTYRPWAPVPMV